MKRTGLVWMAMLAAAVWAESAPAQTQNPSVRFETDKGAFVMRLEPESAPQTVANFLEYVAAGFYDDTIFHRVIPGFMIQGGGLTADMTQKPNGPPITNEADNGLKNKRGTVAMARTMEPHSATSQFFVNTVDNGPLDHTGKSPQGWGYCVFGEVVEGMDVVDAIAKVPTTTRNGMRDVPVEPVRIVKAAVVEPTPAQ